jgi:hypothetical protein
MDTIKPQSADVPKDDQKDTAAKAGSDTTAK